MQYLVMGEDKRQNYLAERLQERNEQVIFWDDYHQQPVDIILLPVARSQEEQKKIIPYLQCGQIIFGSGFIEELYDQCGRKKIQIVDYMQQEGVAVKNAVSVAEGAIVTALKLGKYTIQGSRCLVTGYGVCGKKLCEKLMAWKASVVVVEKEKQGRAQALADGCLQAFSKIRDINLRQMDYIFNTVPAYLFSPQDLQQMNKDVTIIDLASTPGGFQMEACSTSEIHIEKAPGLPGKYGAGTAAEILLRVIDDTLNKNDLC